MHDSVVGYLDAERRGGGCNRGVRMRRAHRLRLSFRLARRRFAACITPSEAVATVGAYDRQEFVMRRLNPFSSSRDRVAQEPPSPGSTNGKTTAETARPQPETATPQPLSQAPKRAATHGAAKSNQSILASARKTFASLQKSYHRCTCAPHRYGQGAPHQCPRPVQRLWPNVIARSKRMRRSSATMRSDSPMLH